jgi:hypothetical protein
MAGRIAYLGNIVTQGLVLDLDAGIKGSYPGVGTTWTDISNNSNNGTLTNGPTFSGSNYGAIVFDGTNDYVDITNNSNLNFGTSNFTSNVWIYPNTSSLITNKEYGIINKNSGFQNTPGWGIELSTYGYSGSFPVVDIIGFNSGQTTWGNATVGNPIKTETWSNINLVRNGSRFDLYTNGSPSFVNTGSNVGFDINNSVNLTLAKNGSWQSSFKGNISNFNLYNQALTQFQIWQNFNAYKVRYGIPDIVTNGLILNLDAGNPYSYLSGSSGTTWTNTVAVSSSISGSLINGTAYLNGAMVFDGVDDYVRCPSISSSINPNNGITLNYFLKTSNTNRRNTLVSNYSVNPYPGITGEIGTTGTWANGLRWQVASNTSTAKVDIYVSNVMQNNTVYFVTFTFDFATKTSKIYLNGVEQSTTSISINPSNITTNWIQNVNLELAADVINSLFYLGNIYTLQVYGKALSSTEITQNFNALRGRYGI